MVVHSNEIQPGFGYQNRRPDNSTKTVAAFEARQGRNEYTTMSGFISLELLKDERVKLLVADCTFCSSVYAHPTNYRRRNNEFPLSDGCEISEPDSPRFAAKRQVGCSFFEGKLVRRL